MTCKYDQRGNLIETAYWGLDGRPAEDANRVARTTSEYDEHGNVTNSTQYDATGGIIKR
jgi:hypothetical protein